MKLLVLLFSFTHALDNGLFLTPPMGWLSWARFRCTTDCTEFPQDCIQETLYTDMASRMVLDGWYEAGYDSVNIDDCWMAPERDELGKLQADATRFPSGIAALSTSFHASGLKLGIYSDVGEKTCAGLPGSLHHYALDAATFAEWGVDSLKLDGCDVKDPALYAAYYPAMSKALNDTGRPIAFICSWPAYVQGHADWEAIRHYCNSWRNYDDIQNNFESVNGVIDWFAEHQEELVPIAGPGGWNDPDMLVMGNYGLTLGQAKIQFSLWCIMAAPLMLSMDLRDMDTDLKDLLQNPEVILVNQDPLGEQGRRLNSTTKGASEEIWVRTLQGGDLAVAIVQRESGPFFPHTVSIRMQDLPLNLKESHCVTIRDLFERTTIGNIRGSFKVDIHYQDAVMYRLTPNTCENVGDNDEPKVTMLRDLLIALLIVFTFGMAALQLQALRQQRLRNNARSEAVALLNDGDRL